jgi:hypothetical protein
MQVNPFVPLRKVRIFPSAPMATMVAPLPTLAGAAVIALAIICSSVAGAFADDLAFLAGADFAVSGLWVSSPYTTDARSTISAAPTVNKLLELIRMTLSLHFD